MYQRTCATCGVEFTAGRKDGRFCSRPCRQRQYRDSARRTCSIEQCDKPCRARDLCQSHYNQTYQANRHDTETAPCDVCGRSVLKAKSRSRSRKVTCSNRCRYFVQFGRFPAGTHLVHVGPAAATARPTLFEGASIAGVKTRFVSGACAWCGDWFTFDLRVGGVPATTCTDACRRKLDRSRSRARRGRFAVPLALRLAIYERDEWMCQLCFEPIDCAAHYLSDWAPSLDHIEPQSHALIPDHSADNLRTAHRWCNSVRGDERFYTAADLVAS